MNTKHTPGPWQAYEAFSGKHYVGTPHKGTGHFVIADVMPSKMETIHNSRLIAAAPDLLAALEAIDKASCNGPCMSLESQKQFCELARVIIELRHLARAAIAKAKGE